MSRPLPDFKSRAEKEHARIGEAGALRLLDAAAQWDLSEALREGGAVLFPHFGIERCGIMVAAAVRAALQSGTQKVLALGVLHGVTEELRQARDRARQGGSVEAEKLRGIQGPGLAGRTDWQAEFSLLHFRFLWEVETKRRGGNVPELVLRYPFLVGEHAETLPGITELQELVAGGAVVVGTADTFHHGIGYGDPEATALFPDAGGLQLGRHVTEEALEFLQAGDLHAYERHCIETKSDARDVGAVLRCLLGPMQGRIIEMTWEDMSHMYSSPAPTWVAGALIELRRLRPGS